jgi:hypothetical protein
MPVNTTDIILASAVRFLIDGGDFEAAQVLLLCELDLYKDDHGNECIELRGPRSAYDAIQDDQRPIRSAVGRAFHALGVYTMRIKAQIITVDPAWRTEFMVAAKGIGVDNQATDVKNFTVWKNLRFRSASEIRIAQALDAAGVAFWPNCKARLGLGTRCSREADFVVCHKGKFGLLEVDGEAYRPASRTVHDHDQDRLFQAHGILIAEHFDAGECFENAEGVVSKFLSILEQAR